MIRKNCSTYCPPHCEFEPDYCPPIDCPDGIICTELIPSDAIIFEGTYLECFGITAGMNLTDVVLTLAALVFPECNTTTTTSTTTTTTLCQRPTGLTQIILVESFDDGTTIVTFTGSYAEACTASNLIINNSSYFLNTYVGEISSLIPGVTVYDTGFSTDCSVVPDGWYINADDYSQIINIVNGILTTITGCTLPTTSTTTTSSLTCDCITFNNTSATDQECWYNDCSGVYTAVTVLANTIAKYCGCCGGTASPSFVLITTGGACIAGQCPTTTTTTTASQAAKCVDCVPQLDNITQNAIGVLSVGDLISTAGTPCVVGDYVIDWYLDSISNLVEFVSGVGSDPAIDQLHPFINTAARPCIAGNWIPVIRYVYLDSVKYTSSYTPGGGNVYSPDLAACLDPIVVENLNCSNGTVSVGAYSHSIQYQAVIQNPADSLRTFRFDLDALVNYFAWQLSAFTVSDKIEFYYVSGSTQTLLGQYAVGLDLSGTNFTGAIKEIYSTSFKEVFDLSTFSFVSGDHINVIITSSYADPSNQNTNWVFNCKCLDAFDCTWIKQQGVEPCNLQPIMTFDSVNCQYVVSYNYITNTNANSSSNITQYLAHSIVYTGNGINPIAGYNRAQYFNIGQKCTRQTGPGNGACHNAQLRTITKVGSVYTISFTDNTDYLSFKSNYNTSHANAMTSGGGYSIDPTNIDHYIFLNTFLPFDAGLLGCGDNITFKYLYHHVTSPYTFNDITLTFELTVVNVTNSLTLSCPCASIDGMIGSVANSISQTDFTQQTTVNTPYQTYETWWTIDTFADTQVYSYSVSYHWLPYTISNYVCTEINGWNVQTQSPGTSQIQYYELYTYITITDITDPINNFKIESIIDPITGLTVAPIIQYEILNGIVTIPVEGCP